MPPKPLRLIVTDRAKADFRAIRKHIAKESPESADAFLKDLAEKIFALAKAGVTGSPRDWVSRSLRVFPYQERCFYFRIKDDEMRLIRVLHQKQDVSAQNFDE